VSQVTETSEESTCKFLRVFLEKSHKSGKIDNTVVPGVCRTRSWKYNARRRRRRRRRRRWWWWW